MKAEQEVNFEKQGFVIINGIYSIQEVEAMTDLIESASTDKPAFRKSNDLFAIRQFLQEIPTIKQLIFTYNLTSLIKDIFGTGHFIVKSIYFDKPPASNWFVSYHQDLTIAVNQKAAIEGFNNWTVKQNQYAVQPPVTVLQNNFTVRIHLDDTNENNGALKVIPGSHLKGILRPETLNPTVNAEEICKVKKGGVMVMRPLLLHASGKTTNAGRRRVIHIEFSNCKLPLPLQWAEYQEVDFA